MLKFLFFIGLIYSFWSCEAKKVDVTINTSKESKIDSDTLIKKSYLSLKQDVAIIPTWRLEINLSDKAIETLNQLKEPLTVECDFYSTTFNPQKTKNFVTNTNTKDTLNILKAIKKLQPVVRSNEIDFENLFFNKEIYESLNNKDLSVKIRIFNQGRYLKKNSLQMESYNDKLSGILNHSNFINLNGKLVNE